MKHANYFMIFRQLIIIINRINTNWVASGF